MANEVHQGAHSTIKYDLLTNDWRTALRSKDFLLNFKTVFHTERINNIRLYQTIVPYFFQHASSSNCIFQGLAQVLHQYETKF